MAETLKEFDFKKGANVKYPWNEWHDGKIYKAFEDDDYNSFHSFRHILYTHADRNDMKVRVRRLREEKATVFQFYKNDKG